MVVQLDVDDGWPSGRVGPIRTVGLGTRKGHRAKVGQGSVGTIHVWVCDDPFCVLPTERMGRIEVLLTKLAIGEILDRGETSRRRKCGDIDSDNITGRDGEVGEVVPWVREPLVPSYNYMVR